jgi:hypothetical protein
MGFEATGYPRAAFRESRYSSKPSVEPAALELAAFELATQ